MIISKKEYTRLLTHNKKLTKEIHKLESENKRLALDNDIYYEGAIRWHAMYNKMLKKFNRETKSPIIDQRDAEINALKHMLERLETSQEENKLQTRTLNKENNELIEQLSDYQRKLSFLRCMFETKLEVAEVYHNGKEALMWKAFLKEVE